MRVKVNVDLPCAARWRAYEAGREGLEEDECVRPQRAQRQASTHTHNTQHNTRTAATQQHTTRVSQIRLQVVILRPRATLCVCARPRRARAGAPLAPTAGTVRAPAPAHRRPAPALLAHGGPRAARAAGPVQRRLRPPAVAMPPMCPQAFAPAAVWPSGPFREGGAPRSRAARASISAAQVLCSAAAKTRPPRGEARPTATVGRRRGRDKGGGGCAAAVRDLLRSVRRRSRQLGGGRRHGARPSSWAPGERRYPPGAARGSLRARRAAGLLGEGRPQVQRGPPRCQTNVSSVRYHHRDATKHARKRKRGAKTSTPATTQNNAHHVPRLGDAAPLPPSSLPNA